MILLIWASWCKVFLTKLWDILLTAFILQLHRLLLLMDSFRCLATIWSEVSYMNQVLATIKVIIAIASLRWGQAHDRFILLHLRLCRSSTFHSWFYSRRKMLLVYLDSLHTIVEQHDILLIGKECVRQLPYHFCDALMTRSLLLTLNYLVQRFFMYPI